MTENEPTKAHIATYDSFLAPDPASFGVYKMIEELYPAFAHKIFHKNPIMRKYIMSGYNPQFILDRPVCGKCETLAAWSGPIVKNGRKVKTCGCLAIGCGATTINPVLFRTWLIDELRHKAPPNIAEIAEYAVDMVAESLMRVAVSRVKQAMEEHNEMAKGEIL